MKPAGLRSPPCPLCTNVASCSETLLGMDFGGGGRGTCLGSIPAGLAHENLAGDGCLLKVAAEDDLLSTWVMKNVPLSLFFFKIVSPPESPRALAAQSYCRLHGGCKAWEHHVCCLQAGVQPPSGCRSPLCAAGKVGRPEPTLVFLENTGGTCPSGNLTVGLQHITCRAGAAPARQRPPLLWEQLVWKAH